MVSISYAGLCSYITYECTDSHTLTDIKTEPVLALAKHVKQLSVDMYVHVLRLMR